MGTLFFDYFWSIGEIDADLKIEPEVFYREKHYVALLKWNNFLTDSVPKVVSNPTSHKHHHGIFLTVLKINALKINYL